MPKIRNKFTLTRRSPDDDKFMIMDGGNTRLKILKELWDERFYRLNGRRVITCQRK